MGRKWESCQKNGEIQEILQNFHTMFVFRLKDHKEIEKKKQYPFGKLVKNIISSFFTFYYYYLF